MGATVIAIQINCERAQYLHHKNCEAAKVFAMQIECEGGQGNWKREREREAWWAPIPSSLVREEVIAIDKEGDKVLSVHRGQGTCNADRV